MCERISDLVDGLRAAVSSLEASALSGADAARLVEVLSEAERLSVAGRTLAAGRVVATGEWARSAHRTPAQWVAARTKSTLGEAIDVLSTAHLLESLPATREAFVAGLLSEVQAAEITTAAAVDPAAEQSLLAIASDHTIAQLKEQCRQVKASAAGDEDAAERIRRGRYLRNWIDRDGAVRVDGRLTPEDGAKLFGPVEKRAAELQDAARRSGQREPAEAYRADALVALVSGDSTDAVVHVHVDADAFERGRTEPGEECAILGVAPIGVAVARRLALNGVVKVIERDGVDVRRVAHPGRTIPAHLRTALEVRDRVPGCDMRNGLEIDHIVPFADGGSTTLDNLARLCRFHHAGKTHHGWVLGGRPGAWSWQPP